MRSILVMNTHLQKITKLGELTAAAMSPKIDEKDRTFNFYDHLQKD